MKRRRRPPIDRSMIGLPQNFQHTAHIGSSDVAMGSRHLVALQNHMQSKGGYDTAVPIEDAASRQAPTVTVTWWCSSSWNAVLDSFFFFCTLRKPCNTNPTRWPESFSLYKLILQINDTPFNTKCNFMYSQLRDGIASQCFTLLIRHCLNAIQSFDHFPSSFHLLSFAIYHT